VIGIVIGLAGSLMLNGILRSLLFEVSPLDPLSLVLASLSMLLVGAGAGVSPANRAARVDPAFVLRDSG
jgi:ABC-type antimicrobial peptide transport system permease subunit